MFSPSYVYFNPEPINALLAVDEVPAPGTETMLGFSDHVRSFVNPVWTSSLTGNSSQTGNQSDIGNEKVQGPLRTFPPAIALEHHPCENFSFSPPPVDRKRSGPRRKFLTNPIQSYGISESNYSILNLCSMSCLLCAC